MKTRLISLDYHSLACDTSLNDLPVVVGRSSDAGLRLDDASVSPCHCRIERIDGQLMVRDLGSRYGTFVNGRSVTESPLLPGDCLSIGMLNYYLQCTEDSDRDLAFDEGLAAMPGAASETACQLVSARG